MSRSSTPFERTLKLRTHACRTLLQAWLSWRREGPVPRYSDIDPGDIRSILPMVGILDVRSKDNAVFRLAGSGLRDIFGFDPTGRNAVELAPESYRTRRAYRIYVPATTPCGYLGESHFVYGGGVTDVFESLGLPMLATDPASLNLLIFTLESLLGRRWEKKGGGMIENPENIFRFLDIGAGPVPPIDAPDDFLSS